MPEQRSASQILFGYLPEQTVDVRGGVWKVKSWRHAQEERNVDGETLRRELCRLAGPWEASGKDGGLVKDLYTGRGRVRVKSLDRQNGVELEPFPRTWICRACNRLHPSPDSACECKSTGRKGQLHFVGYCADCGDVREPWIRKCKAHQQVRVKFPGTASGSEIVFSCPTCNSELQKGFGFPVCSCGGKFTFNVHRAASVFTPRSVVIVNPPSPHKIRQIQEAGGGPRALGWVLDGMRTATMLQGRPDMEALRRQLISQGLPEKVVDEMLRAATDSGEFHAESDAGLPNEIAEEAEGQATTIALAMSDSRIQIADLINSVEPLSVSGVLYRERYKQALEDAGLVAVELIDKFPVLTGHYGYTRGGSGPGDSRLRAYRDRSGDYIVYGDIAETEALFVRLSPERVAEWLRSRGYNLGMWHDSRSAHLAILRAAQQAGSSAGGTRTVHESLTMLVHSYAHRLIRLTAVHAGIERNSLSELLVPLHQGFFLYAAARGDFVLGGLQAVFEGDLHMLLREFVHGEHRCALDPGCTRGGGACVACLQLGEPSCRFFNMMLDRRLLFGGSGYLGQPVIT